MLTVIIPIYKVADTLDRCVKSVLAQEGVDMEVVLVDDGSPDECPHLCDVWAEKDSRIRVVHKTNGGLSDARNAGLAVAKGEYVTFVDSDDEVSEGSFAAAMAAMADDCDMLEYPVRIDIGSPSERKLSFDDCQYDVSSPEMLRQYWLQGEVFKHCYACNKVFRRSLFDNVLFPVGRAYEDLWILPELLSKVKKVATVSRGEYLYYYNKVGICRSQQYEGMRLEALLRAGDIMGVRWEEGVSKRMLMDIVNCQIVAYRSTHRVDERVRQLMRYASLSTADNWCERVKLVLLRLLGIKVFCFFLSLVNVFDFGALHVKDSLK